MRNFEDTFHRNQWCNLWTMLRLSQPTINIHRVYIIYKEYPPGWLLTASNPWQLESANQNSFGNLFSVDESFWMKGNLCTTHTFTSMVKCIIAHFNFNKKLSSLPNTAGLELHGGQLLLLPWSWCPSINSFPIDLRFSNGSAICKMKKALPSVSMVKFQAWYINYTIMWNEQWPIHVNFS